MPFSFMAVKTGGGFRELAGKGPAAFVAPRSFCWPYIAEALSADISVQWLGLLFVADLTCRWKCQGGQRFNELVF